MLNNEEKNTTAFLESYENQHQGEPLLMEFSEGDVYKCRFDTAYESDNGLETDDPLYDEFYELVYEVIDVIKPGPNCEKQEYGICINYKHFPIKVITENGSVIFQAL